MIHVLATIELAAGTRDAFLSVQRENLPNVRAEDGCLEYGPAVDLETEIPAQPAARPDTVVMIEKWRDLDALRAHLAAPHMDAYRAQVKEMVTRTTLQVLQPA